MMRNDDERNKGDRIDQLGFWDSPPDDMTDAEWVKWQRKNQENLRKIWTFCAIAGFAISVIGLILMYAWV